MESKKNKNQPTFLVKNNTIYFLFLNETFKTITKCFRTHAIFLHAGCMYQGCTTIFAFFAITENLMTKRSFIFGIFHEQKEKKNKGNQYFIEFFCF